MFDSLFKDFVVHMGCPPLPLGLHSLNSKVMAFKEVTEHLAVEVGSHDSIHVTVGLEGFEVQPDIAAAAELSFDALNEYV